MTMQCLKYHQVQGLCILSGGLFVNPIKRSNSRGSGCRKRGSYRPHIEAREGGGSVKADQVPRGKLSRATKIASSCFGQAGEGIALYCLIGDDVHPYLINVCNDPVSSRARQVNRNSGGSAGECQECSERGVIHGDGAADRIEALFRQEGRINTFRVGQKYFVA